MNSSYKTAIHRKGPSAPARQLAKYAEGRILDYGCGHGADAEFLGAEKFDPYWYPFPPKGTFDTIFCTYVLNTIPKNESFEDILESMYFLLSKEGRIFITVRRDIQKEGLTSKGTYQYNVVFPSKVLNGRLLCRSVIKNNNYETYLLWKEDV